MIHLAHFLVTVNGYNDAVFSAQPPQGPLVTARFRIRRIAGKKRVLTAVGASAGTAAGLSAVCIMLFRAQGRLARQRIGKPLGELAPQADRMYKKKKGNPLQLLLLGDSIAAGLGAERPEDTLGARLARGLAKRTERAVRLRTAAIVGSESSALAGQLSSLPADYRPELAVIVVGGNDVTHRIPPGQACQQLADAIQALQRRGASVVVGTCPDLGTLRPVPQPLRSVASLTSRRMAALQAQTARRYGADYVMLGRLVGPMFRDEPETMFSIDRFHPSSTGYRRTAKAMLPVVLRQLEQRSEK